MPGRKSTKAGVLENLIGKEVVRSVKEAINKYDLASSKDLNSLVAEVRMLRKQLSSQIKAKPSRKRPGRKPTHVKCTVRGCNKPHYAKGLCASHYQKQRRDAEAAKTTAKAAGKKTARKKRSAKKK